MPPSARRVAVGSAAQSAPPAPKRASPSVEPTAAVEAMASTRWSNCTVAVFSKALRQLVSFSCSFVRSFVRSFVHSVHPSFVDIR